MAQRQSRDRAGRAKAPAAKPFRVKLYDSTSPSTRGGGDDESGTKSPAAAPTPDGPAAHVPAPAPALEMEPVETCEPVPVPVPETLLAKEVDDDPFAGLVDLPTPPKLAMAATGPQGSLAGPVFRPKPAKRRASAGRKPPGPAQPLAKQAVLWITGTRRGRRTAVLCVPLLLLLVAASSDLSSLQLPLDSPRIMDQEPEVLRPDELHAEPPTATSAAEQQATGALEQPATGTVDPASAAPNEAVASAAVDPQAQQKKNKHRGDFQHHSSPASVASVVRLLLANLGLSFAAEGLAGLGVETIDDLQLVIEESAEDLLGIGLTKVQILKLRRAVRSRVAREEGEAAHPIVPIVQPRRPAATRVPTNGPTATAKEQPETGFWPSATVNVASSGSQVGQPRPNQAPASGGLRGTAEPEPPVVRHYNPGSEVRTPEVEAAQEKSEERITPTVVTSEAGPAPTQAPTLPSMDADTSPSSIAAREEDRAAIDGRAPASSTAAGMQQPTSKPGQLRIQQGTEQVAQVEQKEAAEAQQPAEKVQQPQQGDFETQHRPEAQPQVTPPAGASTLLGAQQPEEAQQPPRVQFPEAGQAEPSQAAQPTAAQQSAGQSEGAQLPEAPHGAARTEGEQHDQVTLSPSPGLQPIEPETVGAAQPEPAKAQQPSRVQLPEAGQAGPSQAAQPTAAQQPAGQPEGAQLLEAPHGAAQTEGEQHDQVTLSPSPGLQRIEPETVGAAQPEPAKAQQPSRVQLPEAGQAGPSQAAQPTAAQQHAEQPEGAQLPEAPHGAAQTEGEQHDQETSPPPPALQRIVPSIIARDSAPAAPVEAAPAEAAPSVEMESASPQDSDRNA